MFGDKRKQETRMHARCWTVAGLVLLCHLMLTAAASGSPREMKALRSLYSKKRGKERSNLASKMSALSGEYVPEVGPWSSEINEPTCEQLREMWRQSKRHSRAAESTNEIPQYIDPFARALQSYSRQIKESEAPLRPRPERRPVIYGRIHHTPAAEEAADKLRPFDVLRKLNGQDREMAKTPPASDTELSGTVLLTENDRSPYPKAASKGSMGVLRKISRDEQVGGSLAATKGSFHHLRDMMRDEQLVLDPSARHESKSNSGKSSFLSSSSSWPDADIGRIVTSPSDHKYSMYAMQGDAPYAANSDSGSGSQRPFQVVRPNRLRLADLEGRPATNRQLTRKYLDRVEGARKAFHLTEPQYKAERMESRLKNRRQLAGSTAAEDSRSYLAPTGFQDIILQPSSSWDEVKVDWSPPEGRDHRKQREEPRKSVSSDLSHLAGRAATNKQIVE